MTAQTLVVVVIVGLIAGWLAGFVMKGGGYGLAGDIVLGLGGSMVAAGLFRLLGFAPAAGWVAVVGVAFVGSILLVFAQRTLWPTHA